MLLNQKVASLGTTYPYEHMILIILVGSDRSNNCATTTALFFDKQNKPSLKQTEVGN